MAASVVLVAPLRVVTTIITGAAPNSSPPSDRHRQTIDAGDHLHCHTERRTRCWRRSSTPQVDLRCWSLSMGSPAAQRAMPQEPPSPQLLKRGCCRAPPRSSHRAASAIVGIGAPRACETRSKRVNASPSPQLLKRGCCRAPPRSSHRAASAIVGIGAPRACETRSKRVNASKFPWAFNTAGARTASGAQAKPSAVDGHHPMTTPMSSDGGECRVGGAAARCYHHHHRRSAEFLAAV